MPNPSPPIIAIPIPIKTIPPTLDPLDLFLSDDPFENIIYPGMKNANPISINITRERATPIPTPNPNLTRDFKVGEFLAILF